MKNNIKSLANTLRKGSIMGSILSGSVVTSTSTSNLSSWSVRQASPKRRLRNCCQFFITVAPPTAIMLILSGIVLSRSLSDIMEAKSMKRQYQQALSTYSFVKSLQMERGCSVLYVSAPTGERPKVMAKLKLLRAQSNRRLRAIRRWVVATTEEQEEEMLEMASPQTFRLGLRIFRREIDRERVSDATEILKWYTSKIYAMLSKIAQIFYADAEWSNTFWGRVNALLMSEIGHDSLGVKRGLGSAFFEKGHFNDEEYRMFSEHEGMAARMQADTRGISADIERLHAKLEAPDHLAVIERQIDALQRQIFANNNSDGLDKDLALTWYQWCQLLPLPVALVMCRFSVDDALAADIASLLREQLIRSRLLMFITLVLVGCAALVCPMIFIWYNRMQHQIQKKQAETNNANNLLNQILPKTVAEKLQHGEEVMPEMYEEVTVYFSDIKGFTVLSSKSSPMEVVYFLNELYRVMDDVIDQYKVYKVETIGDAYMVASGAPIRISKRHSAEMCTMALAMLKQISIFHIPHMPHETVLMRIGIHTGPLAAGIVGTKMPRYCLFGDTVSYASRMESTGLPMRIQISADTLTHLTVHFKNQFSTTERGTLEVKGKGPQKTYWLLEKVGFNYTVDLKAAQVLTDRATYPYEENAESLSDSRIDLRAQFVNGDAHKNDDDDV